MFFQHTESDMPVRVIDSQARSEPDHGRDEGELAQTTISTERAWNRPV